MKILIPVSPLQPEGPFATVNEECFEILADRGDVLIIRVCERPEGINWFENYEVLLFKRHQESSTVRAVNIATNMEIRGYRAPLWIQDSEIPACCGKPLHFVAQIDDDHLCDERPAQAKLWWHDRASFYIFTCDQCLECKAVGQQY